MERKIVKPSAIRPAPESESISTPAPVLRATAVSTSSSSTAASSSSDTIPTVAEHPIPARQSDTESESDSDADSDSPSNPVNYKPVNSNPAELHSESESDSEPTPPTKRPAEIESSSVKRPAEIESSSVKRAKKDNLEPVKPAVPIKKLFERVWSNEDELVILKGLYDYKAKEGIDPAANSDDFVTFIKKHLRTKSNKTQIMGKIRRLKKRLDTLSKRKKIGDPHDIKVFELSRKVWSVGGDEPIVTEVQTKKKTGLSGGDGENAKRMGDSKVENVGVDVDREVDLAFGDGSGTVLRDAMKRVEGTERTEMRMMVEKANVACLNAYLLRLKVLEVAAKKNLDGICNDLC